MLDRIFKLSEHKTNIKTEIVAGTSTFLAMAYIIVVNPQILSNTGMDYGAVFVATCLAAAIAGPHFSKEAICTRVVSAKSPTASLAQEQHIMPPNIELTNIVRSSNKMLSL